MFVIMFVVFLGITNFLFQYPFQKLPSSTQHTARANPLNLSAERRLEGSKLDSQGNVTTSFGIMHIVLVLHRIICQYRPHYDNVINIYPLWLMICLFMLIFLTGTVLPIRTVVAMHQFRLINPMQLRSNVWSSDNWSLFSVGVDRKLTLQQILKK
jgi:hypothetical protein